MNMFWISLNSDWLCLDRLFGRSDWPVALKLAELLLFLLASLDVWCWNSSRCTCCECLNCWTLLSCEGSEDTAMGPAEWLDPVWGGCHAHFATGLSWWYDKWFTYKSAWTVYCICIVYNYNPSYVDVTHVGEREREMPLFGNSRIQSGSLPIKTPGSHHYPLSFLPTSFSLCPK